MMCNLLASLYYLNFNKTNTYRKLDRPDGRKWLHKKCNCANMHGYEIFKCMILFFSTSEGGGYSEQ